MSPTNHQDYMSCLGRASNEVLCDLIKANKLQRDTHSGPSIVLTQQHNLIMNEMIKRRG